MSGWVSIASFILRPPAVILSIFHCLIFNGDKDEGFCLTVSKMDCRICINVRTDGNPSDFSVVMQLVWGNGSYGEEERRWEAKGVLTVVERHVLLVVMGSLIIGGMFLI